MKTKGYEYIDLWKRKEPELMTPLEMANRALAKMEKDNARLRRWNLVLVVVYTLNALLLLAAVLKLAGVY